MSPTSVRGVGPLRSRPKVDELHRRVGGLEAEAGPLPLALLSDPKSLVGPALGRAVHRRPTVRGRGDLAQILPGQVAGEHGTALPKGRERSLVVVVPFALEVGRVGTAHVGPLVPIDSEPAQLVEIAVYRLRDGAGSVQVLDPEDELPVQAPRPPPGDQGGAGVPQVEPAGGARCEAASVGHGLRGRAGCRCRPST